MGDTGLKILIERWNKITNECKGINFSTEHIMQMVCNSIELDDRLDRKAELAKREQYEKDHPEEFEVHNKAFIGNAMCEDGPRGLE